VIPKELKVIVENNFTMRS